MGKGLSRPSRHGHLLGDRKGLVPTVVTLSRYLQNHTTNLQKQTKNGNNIHATLSKLMILCLFPPTAVLGGMHPLTWTSRAVCEPNTFHRLGQQD